MARFDQNEEVTYTKACEKAAQGNDITGVLWAQLSLQRLKRS